MRYPADYWIKTLGLSPHTEGGAFRRVYASGIRIPQEHLPGSFHGSRPSSSAIYFLLEKGQLSAMHRIASDELWHFYYGDPLEIYEIDLRGKLTKSMLGNDPENNESFQYLVKGGHWFGAKVKDEGNYSLVGCTVSPGFDFEDFEMGRREDLIRQYPGHETVIRMLTLSQ